MAAVWQRNEAIAAKRRCDVRAYSKTDGSDAPRATSFAGFIYLSKSSYQYVAALGTLTNKRHILSAADDTVEAVDHATNDTLQLTAHVFETGDGGARFTTTGTLPAPLALATDYWLIKFDNNNVRVATSLANAYAGVFINLTSAGTGTHTLDVTASTERGIDGEWIYEATQAETDFAGSEAVFAILGHTTYRASTTINLENDSTTSPMDQICEDGHTYGDVIRGLASLAMAELIISGSTYTWRDLADTKDRFTGEANGSGRPTVTINDLTP